MASLVVLKGPNQGQRVELDRDKIVLGRNPDCDLVVPGPAVSREHAQILRINNCYYIKDLESRNKTYLTNQEVSPDTPVRLQDNDRIKICDFLFSFHEGPRKPLPEVLRPDTVDEDAAEGESSTVMSTVDPSTSSQLILESQPAERLRILLDITNSLAGTLELDPLLPKVIDQLFQIFKQADRGFVIVRDDATRKLVPKAIKARREKDEASARFSRKIVNQCIDEGKAILSEDAMTDDRFALSQSISDFRIRSVMCAPLRGQDGRVFGVLQLDTQDRSKKFTDDDLQLLVAVSNQAAVAMDNARLHESIMAKERIDREIKFAKEVQHVLLPANLPTVSGYAFFAHY